MTKLAATKAKMSGSEKNVDRNTYDISSIKRVETRKFLELGSCSRAKQRQRNVQKVYCTCEIVYPPHVISPNRGSPTSM